MPPRVAVAAAATVSAAQHMKSKRVVDNTRRCYEGKLNVIKIHLLSDPSTLDQVDINNNIIVPLSKELANAIFGWLSTNTDIPKKGRKTRKAVQDIEANEDDDADVEEDDEEEYHDETEEEVLPLVPDEDDDVFALKKITMSSSCMQGYKSALLWLYRENNVIMSAEIDAEIEEIIKGYKKTVALKKSGGIMKLQEGKSSISFNGYSAIAEALLTLQPEKKKFTWLEGIFGWTFMVLCWNLIGRSASIGNLMYQHIRWKEDALVVLFAMHKGDQLGENCSEDAEKHMYANTENPAICPLLSLALHTWCTNRVGDISTQKVFEGGKAEQRFSKVLSAVLKIIPDWVPLGARKCDIGSHSNRKGASSYCLALSVCISAVSVYLRAGWSLGNVQDRYNCIVKVKSLLFYYI
jgi:hypothetical protein